MKRLLASSHCVVPFPWFSSGWPPAAQRHGLRQRGQEHDRRVLSLPSTTLPTVTLWTRQSGWTCSIVSHAENLALVLARRHSRPNLAFRVAAGFHWLIWIKIAYCAHLIHFLLEVKADRK